MLIICRIITPLVKMFQSSSTPLPAWQLNPISWNSHFMRIVYLETISTRNHPSPAVAAAKHQVILAAAIALLCSGISRKEIIAANPLTASHEVEKLSEEIEEMTGLVEIIKSGDDMACNHWDMEMTWVVARRAIIVNQKESWMSAKYPA